MSNEAEDAVRLAELREDVEAYKEGKLAFVSLRVDTIDWLLEQVEWDNRSRWQLFTIGELEQLAAGLGLLALERNFGLTGDPSPAAELARDLPVIMRLYSEIAVAAGWPGIDGMTLGALAAVLDQKAAAETDEPCG